MMAMIYDVSDFLDQGGPALFGIFVISVLLWGLFIERWLYVFIWQTKDRDALLGQWERFRLHDEAVNIREYYKAEFSKKLLSGFNFIGVLISIAPLLGLLGTVSGMIEIFEVIAQSGTGDARAMAGGISMATLPTMSGMAVAICGLLIQHALKARTDKNLLIFNEKLV